MLEVFDLQLLFNMQQAADLGLTPEQRTELDDAIAAWTVGQPSPVNHAPVAGDDPDVHVGPSWQSLSGVLAPASDADGDRLIYQLVPDSAENGTVTLDSQTGAWVFTGTSGYSGPAQFRYVVSDGQATSDEQTVSLTLELVTHAVSDAATLKEATTLTVPADSGLLANDSSSLAGGSVRVGSVNGEAENVGQPVLGLHGSITIDADGSYTFVPDPETAGLIEGESATDSFTYSIVDDEGVTSAATLTLTLTITGVGGGVFYGNGRFIGSAYGDRMTGGTEADVIIGNGGDDVIDGGFGAPNQLHGGRGNDWFILDAADSVIEYEGEGVDTVEARISSYHLAANVENLIYTGPASFSGWGNELDNHITGGGANDYLRGMGGNDIIDGGAGLDTLYLRGLAADYTITAEGEGYRIDDAVAGRDGSTFVLSIEYLRYSNGSTGVLTYPPAAAAGPGEAKEAAGDGVSPPRLDSGPGKDDSGPQVLPPGFDDDAFLAGTDDHRPLVLPGAPDDGVLDFRTGGFDDLGRQTQLTAFEDPTHVPDVDGTGLGRFDSGGLGHVAPAFGPWGLAPDDQRLWAGLDARLPLSGPATDHDPWG